ncbi:Methyltransferase domain-containing protein [Modestobacter sp. DSM 44400]|uniref:class I SAM-dependent methyltransferase n=1 Tax=Modestobacter sp. DSM 44400 TaxID=1550230 RepID=UPI00089C3D75|nr:class I SAM-dependent methyltransferase [Modestobacter sp. DSM 44400]SDY01979.1 Methyltransferase domain-containing protein [Modestobacter sp. DSM 44400]
MSAWQAGLGTGSHGTARPEPASWWRLVQPTVVASDPSPLRLRGRRLLLSPPWDDDGRMYSDADAAALYDVLNPWHPSDDFYLSLVMEAASVLDVGCGTGTVLKAARAAGHPGRLVGIDPDRAALRVARVQNDVEWIECTAASLPHHREFELAIMTGHAFQCLVTDDELRASLAAVHRALVPGGRFAFETRNPAARAWEQWASAPPAHVVDPAGRPLQIAYEVLSVAGGVVSFTETTRNVDGTALRTDPASLRFLDGAALAGFLAEAGFAVRAQFGGWSGQPLEPDSTEIVTVAAGTPPPSGTPRAEHPTAGRTGRTRRG